MADPLTYDSVLSLFKYFRTTDEQIYTEGEQKQMFFLNKKAQTN